MSIKEVVLPISGIEVINLSNDHEIHDFSRQNTITYTTLNSAERSLILNHFNNNQKDLIGLIELAKKIDSTFLCQFQKDNLFFRMEYQYCTLDTVTGNFALFIYLYCCLKNKKRNKKITVIVNNSILEWISTIINYFKIDHEVIIMYQIID